MRDGFSIVEVLVAIAVFVLTLSGASALLFSSQSLYQANETVFKSLLYAQEGIEAVKAMRDGSWDNLSAGDHGLAQSANAWIFSGDSDVLENKYRRVINLTAINENKFQVTSQVSWFNSVGKEREVHLTAYLTNWQRAREDASSGVANLGDSSKAVYVDGAYTYLAINDSAKTLAVVDTADPLSPQVLTNLGLNGRGIDVFIDGNYAYVAIDANKVVIVDISDPSTPSQIASISLSAQPNAVFVQDGYLYIGQDKNNEGLVIYSVANPQYPYFWNSYNIQGSAVHDVKLRNGFIFMTINAGRGFDMDEAGNYAFVSVDSAGGGFEVERILYYRWWVQIQRIAIVDIGGAGSDVFLNNNTAYVAARVQDAGLVEIDVTDPESPAYLGGTDIGGEGNGVFYQNGYAYMAVENAGGGLVIKAVD